MKYFVRNLFTKMLLLALLAVPLLLYALSEFRQLVSAGGNGTREVAVVPDAELKVLQDRAARIVEMPADVRRELTVPTGGEVKEPAEATYRALAETVRARALLLSGQRRFLEECAIVKADSRQPAFDGPLLGPHYARVWSDRRDMAAKREQIAKLRGQLLKADSKASKELASQLSVLLGDYVTKWGEDSEIRQALDDLAKRDLDATQDVLKATCDKMEGDFQKVLKAPTAEALRALLGDLDELLKRLRMRESDPRVRGDTARLDWTKKQITYWDARRVFLPRAVSLFDGAAESLKAGKVEPYMAECEQLFKDAPNDEARRVARGIAEDFCTKYLSQPPRQPMKYDSEVQLTGSDSVVVLVPREQIFVGQPKNTFKWLKTGDPIALDGYTEFHVQNDKGATHVTAYDKGGNSPLKAPLTQLPPAALKPTDKSRAVHFYCDEYRKVQRWNASNIRAFRKKCEEHKAHLSDVWDRLQSIGIVVDRMKELFADDAK